MGGVNKTPMVEILVSENWEVALIHDIGTRLLNGLESKSSTERGTNQSSQRRQTTGSSDVVGRKQNLERFGKEEIEGREGGCF